jgi:TolB-like protein
MASGAASIAAKTPKARALSPRLVALAAALFLAVLAAGAYAWHSGLATRLVGASAEDKLANAPRLSIVVLPFENLSGDKEQDYFADGITDDLTTDLSHLRDSFVISRGTAFTYRGKPIDAKQIGKDLGVRYLLEGSVRRVGETITVNAQLISTETGAHVWADRFEGERIKLSELQVEVVARLARSLGAELVKAEALRAMRERPSNPDADLAMRGLIGRGIDSATLNALIGQYVRTLQVAPNSVTAQVGLADALAIKVLVDRPANAADDVARADSLLTSALSADPNNTWAHFAKAELAFVTKQIDVALSESKVATEIDFNLAGPFASAPFALHGVLLIAVGRAAEAIPYVETALRLSPVDPSRNCWEYELCHAYAHLAQWEKAAEWCGKSIASDPSFWPPYIDLAAANGWLGNEAEAHAAIDALHKLRPGFTVQDWASMNWSDDPQFMREYARITEGLRKAGVPEGEKKTN